MGIVDNVKSIDKKMSKFFVPFSILFFGFIFGWKYASGENIFSSYLKIDYVLTRLIINFNLHFRYKIYFPIFPFCEETSNSFHSIGLEKVQISCNSNFFSFPIPTYRMNI